MTSNACLPCKTSMHDECSYGFLSGALDDDQVCCCRESYDPMTEAGELMKAERQALISRDEEETQSKLAIVRSVQIPEKERGDSGYIHPDAWPSTSNIGELSDPLSTGRKRQAKMYPIDPGQVCEWAMKKGNLGGGVMPMVGCLNNPATDLHHGPDKNTLNNEKASYGVGVQENTWIICSDCHNLRHALDDPLYPPYDRVEDQTRPWLPRYPDGFTTVVEDASIDEVMEQEKRRAQDRKRRGRSKRGRNSKNRSGADLTVGSDDE